MKTATKRGSNLFVEESYRPKSKKLRLQSNIRSVPSNKHDVSNLVCVYCKQPDSDENELHFDGVTKRRDLMGRLGRREHTAAHYSCLYFSKGLKQVNIPTMDGLFGFRQPDIAENLKRFDDVLCFYCDKPYASLACEECEVNFHYPCAVDNNVMLDYNQWIALCPSHHRHQKEEKTDNQKHLLKLKTCLICREHVSTTVGFTQLRAPCCPNWFHRSCLQAYAFSAGSHHLRCPNCGDRDRFKDELLTFGYHIPTRDAAWELEPNAYTDLHRGSLASCQGAICLCPNGRNFVGRANSVHELLRCYVCGTNGKHRSCTRRAALNEKWICCDCMGSEDPRSDDEDADCWDKYL